MLEAYIPKAWQPTCDTPGVVGPWSMGGGKLLLSGDTVARLSSIP